MCMCIFTESKANDDEQQLVQQKRGEQHGGRTLFLKKREKKRQEAKAKDVGATASFIRFWCYASLSHAALLALLEVGVLPEFQMPMNRHIFKVAAGCSFFFHHALLPWLPPPLHHPLYPTSCV